MVKKLEKCFAYELAHMLSKNIINPVLLLEHFLERYRNANSNAKLSFTKILQADAIKEANIGWKRQKEGRRLSPLDGLPIAWKDVIDIKSAPAFAGSKILRELRDTKNIVTAQVVNTAIKKGLVSIAKTSTVEFAFGGIGINYSNPLPENLMAVGGLAPGGSSTGAATAVYAGFVPFAVGTDTAGSVRIPAAWHGLVGFKPTYNSISTKGVLPLSPSYDTVGIIAKCIKDTQLLFSTLTNKDYSYSTIEPTKIKIAIVDDFNLNQTSKKSHEAYEIFFKQLAKSNFKITRIKVPEFKEINNYLFEEGSLVNYEAWHSWKKLINKKITEIDRNVSNRFILGKKLNKNKIKIIEEKIKLLITKILKKIDGLDLLITPTISFPPPSLLKLQNPDSYDYYNRLVLNNTRIANICNFSAITIPIYKGGKEYNSVSLFAKAKEDKKLLCIAEKMESILL